MEKLIKHKEEIKEFKHIGVSVHSVKESKEAERFGATYLIAGHIFPTDYKKGVSPRGLLFLKEVCDAVEIPVFAIGGINKDNFKNALDKGAKGICIMSEAMIHLSPSAFAQDYEN